MLILYHNMTYDMNQMNKLILENPTSKKFGNEFSSVLSFGFLTINGAFRDGEPSARDADRAWL